MKRSPMDCEDDRPPDLNLSSCCSTSHQLPLAVDHSKCLSLSKVFMQPSVVYIKQLSVYINMGIKRLPPVMWCFAFCQTGTNILQEPASSIIRVYPDVFSSLYKMTIKFYSPRHCTGSSNHLKFNKNACNKNGILKSVIQMCRRHYSCNSCCLSSCRTYFTLFIGKHKR